jgi:hypothetical protein
MSTIINNIPAVTPEAYTNKYSKLDGISHSRCIKMYDDVNVYNPDSIYYGCGTVKDAGQYSNRVSGIEVPSRTCITMYNDTNLQGIHKTMCNYSYGKGKLFDRVGHMGNMMSSFKVFELQQD